MGDNTLLLLRNIMMESVMGRCLVWFAVAKSGESCWRTLGKLLGFGGIGISQLSHRLRGVQRFNYVASR